MPGVIEVYCPECDSLLRIDPEGAQVVYATCDRCDTEFEIKLNEQNKLVDSIEEVD